jgi:hypothetical protein
LLTAGQRVLAVDPWYFGESKMEKDWLWALMIATIGERPLGLEASQVAAVARWASDGGKPVPVTVGAVGPRTSLIALTAAGLEEAAIGKVELQGSLGSLKQVVETNGVITAAPEQFCFGLLEAFDVKQMTALVAPRPVVFATPSDRVKTELAGLKAWYAILDKEFDPLR